MRISSNLVPLFLAVGISCILVSGCRTWQMMQVDNYERVRASLATSEGRADELKKLLNEDGSLVKKRVDQTGNMLLHIAAAGNRPESISLLLERGADINKENWYGKTAVSYAAMHGNVRCMAVMLGEGHPSAKTLSSALYWGSRRGAEESVRYLLAAGADPTSEPGAKHNPLTEAVRNGYTAIVRLLLEAGADPNVPDWRGRSARDYARDSEREGMRKLMDGPSGT